MKNLKIILQSKYTYYILLIISIIFTYIKITYYPNISKLNPNATKFNLIVKKIRYKENKKIIEFSGIENLISYYKEDFNYKIGDELYIEGNLSNIDSNTIPNTFNNKEYLNNKNIYYILNINKIKYIKSNKLYNIKNYLINRINNLPNKEYLYTFILAENYYIKDEIKESYQNLGINHLLCIGSQSIELIIMTLSLICKKLKIKNNIYIILFSIITTIYIIITDYQISLIRCALSKIIIKITKKKNIKIQYEYIIILLFSITLLINPYTIFNLGFKYSYLISFFLIKYNKLIKGNYIKKLLIISSIAYIVSLPITINNNYQINSLSILFNLIYVPFINIIIFPLSILTFIFPILSNILSIIIKILENSVIYLNSIKKLNIIMPKIPIYLIIIEYISIIIALNSIKNKKYYISFLFLLSLLIHYNYKNIINETYVTFFDIKQGDSSLLKIKNKSILIDTGGIKNKDLSTNTIKYLKSEGIRKLNYLILTHGDYDHMGESINLVNNFKVESVIFNCGEFNELEKKLISILDKTNTKYYSCIKELNVNDNKLYFLNNNDYGNENDNSIVLYTKLNNNKFLFMGDASVKTEKDILSNYNLKDIDVIKVGHHGSKTSSSEQFINSIKPKYAVISVGKYNIYHHPNKEILKILNKSKTYRTDNDGSIIFNIKNNKLDVSTCPP